MVTGQLPWTKRNQVQLFAQISRGEFTIPAFVSERCGDLIQKLMTVDVEERITIERALEHPFLAGVTSVQAPVNITKRISQEAFNACFPSVGSPPREPDVVRPHSKPSQPPVIARPVAPPMVKPGSPTPSGEGRSLSPRKIHAPQPVTAPEKTAVRQ
jgi:serine/threonine protein kinase